MEVLFLFSFFCWGCVSLWVVVFFSVVLLSFWGEGGGGGGEEGRLPFFLNHLYTIYFITPEIGNGSGSNLHFTQDSSWLSLVHTPNFKKKA